MENAGIGPLPPILCRTSLISTNFCERQNMRNPRIFSSFVKKASAKYNVIIVSRLPIFSFLPSDNAIVV